MRIKAYLALLLLSITPVAFSEDLIQLEFLAYQGDSAAQNELGNHFDRLGEYSSSFKWYKKAVDNGNVEALFNLGLAYIKGRGVKKDIQKGIQYWEKASDLGDWIANRNLGVLYYNGQDIPKNYRLSRHYFSLGCAAGDRKSCEHFEYLVIKGY